MKKIVIIGSSFCDFNKDVVLGISNFIISKNLDWQIEFLLPHELVKDTLTLCDVLVIELESSISPDLLNHFGGYTFYYSQSTGSLEDLPNPCILPEQPSSIDLAFNFLWSKGYTGISLFLNKKLNTSKEQWRLIDRYKNCCKAHYTASNIYFFQEADYFIKNAPNIKGNAIIVEDVSIAKTLHNKNYDQATVILNENVVLETLLPLKLTVVKNAGWDAGTKLGVQLHNMLRIGKQQYGRFHAQHTELKNTESCESNKVAPAKLIQTRHFIAKNVNRRICVQDIVNFVNCSRSVIEQQYLSFYGESITQTIKASKNQRVKDMLTETNLSLAEIAHKSGFSSPQYMSSYFKSLNKLSPGQYRDFSRSASI